MFTQAITPRFSETDALGHINNTIVPVWLEQARTPVFRWFTPDLDPKKWRLIIAKIEVNFLREILYGHEVEVSTYIETIGNSSFRIGQEVRQRDTLCAKGTSVMVHFDHHAKQPVPIPEEIRRVMAEHQRAVD